MFIRSKQAAASGQRQSQDLFKEVGRALTSTDGISGTFRFAVVVATLVAVTLGGIMGGLGQLSEATVAADPRTQARLRADALARFTSVTRALDGTALNPGVVGYYDPYKGVIVATNMAWLASTVQDIVDGVGLLQRSLSDPLRHPSIQAAIRQFDKAFAQISSKKVLEG